MRHVFLPRTIVARSLGMVEPTSVARLVALAGGALRAAPCLFGASSRTVDVATVATAADQHLNLAARAKIEARARQSLIGFATETWTKPPTGEILPRHSCSARCGARRRCKLAR
jgi:hypothetical protein